MRWMEMDGDGVCELIDTYIYIFVFSFAGKEGFLEGSFFGERRGGGRRGGLGKGRVAEGDS